MNHWFGLVVIIPIALVGFATISSEYPMSPLIGREPTHIDVQLGIVGSNSCSTSGCHGGGKPTKTGSEWNTWIDRDPHAKAYRVLFNDTSRRIAANLKVECASGGILPAHENQTCLNCHGPSHSFKVLPDVDLLPDGVSCEICHGPAQRYESVHYLSLWKKLSNSEKVNIYGMTHTKKLSVRVKLCASCHIGTENQEVNHALLAAGHPRLFFEYSSYHHHPQYVVHWKETDSSFEIRSWLIGQVASARASLNLLSARASSNHSKIWPEFAEFNCYSCHKTLSSTSNKGSSRAENLESIPWGDWPYALLPILAKEVTVLQSISPKIELLVALRMKMNQKPGLSAEVASLAKDLVAELDRWLLALERIEEPLSIDIGDRLIWAVIENVYNRENKTLRFTDWDSLTQHYLAVSQLYYSRVKKNSAAASPILEEQLKELRAQLYFKGDTNSPQPISISRHTESWQRIHQLVLQLSSHP